jgi:hypothetical protein
MTGNVGKALSRFLEQISILYQWPQHTTYNVTIFGALKPRYKPTLVGE